jgi:hypothetical protein
MSSVTKSGRAAWRGLGGHAGALGTRSSARSEVEPKMWPAVVQRRRAGQASLLGEPGVADGTAAYSLSAGCHGP